MPESGGAMTGGCGDEGAARSVLDRLVSGLRVLGFIVALGALAIWLVGSLASDRWLWTQWFAWIPTPLLLPGLAVGVAAAATLRRRRLWWVAGCAALVLSIGGAHLASRWRPVAPACREAFRIVHWNPAAPGPRTADAYRAALLPLDPDLLLVSNDWWLFGRLRAGRWEEAGRRVIHAGPFAIASKVPVLEARLVVASEQRYVAVVRIDTRETLGRPLTIWLVDFPSDGRRSRMEIARSVAPRLAALDLPEPDLVIGDFNMDAGSAATAALFPGLRNAFAVAGAGYAGSFPRQLPLWHIDRALVGARLDLCGYRLLDPGIGRHRMQELLIRALERIDVAAPPLRERGS